MDNHDPISQFFPDQDDVDLYQVLNLSNTASVDEIKKAYRRLALLYHPDKHATAAEEAKSTASLKFQQVGFAYAVLNDEKRRERYDKTGSTTEGLDLEPGEGGWDAYFEDLFDTVTRQKLDELKKEYQGSLEETEDLKRTYLDTKGSIGEIMNHIPHSTVDDEPRIIAAISKLVKDGELPKMKEWEKSTKDEKARLVRRKQSEKEAKEAESLAKDLGVWDEFYGSGKATKRDRKGKKKEKSGGEDGGEADDTAALQALILKKRAGAEQRMNSFFDNLEAKYSGEAVNGKKKRGRRPVDPDDQDGPATKKRRSESAPDIPDEEWAAIQEKLFSNKQKESKPSGKKGRKASTK